MLSNHLSSNCLYEWWFETVETLESYTMNMEVTCGPSSTIMQRMSTSTSIDLPAINSMVSTHTSHQLPLQRCLHLHHYLCHQDHITLLQIMPLTHTPLLETVNIILIAKTILVIWFSFFVNVTWAVLVFFKNMFVCTYRCNHGMLHWWHRFDCNSHSGDNLHQEKVSLNWWMFTGHNQLKGSMQ